ncbi:hypothetical protein [Lentibacillus daqui]|uniref:hypothetical protein n=1 Tax=Lentibacillus daqui TaxID=2911514 RepID=UPI0022B0F25B|nr:hypothetical protein [Lentibacillus daqui]
MLQTQQINLTINEMVAALSLCGYDKMAGQILNEQELIKNESEFNRFVQETETKLRQKGYWDDNRETGIAKGLEDLLYLLVHAKKKIRCINMRKHRVLLIHLLNKKHSLVQEVKGGEHAFSFYKNSDGFYDILREHFGMRDTETDINGWQPIQMTDELIDELHTSEPELLLTMKQDENQAMALRDFAGDFLRNGQEFDNISFMKSDYVKDQSEFDDIQFLLPGNNFVWHMNYENVEENHQVILEPIPVKTYFEEIERVLTDFFNE